MVIKLGFASDMPDKTSPVGEWSRHKGLQGGGGGSFVCVGEPRLSKIGGRAAAAARMQGGSRSQHSLTSVSRRRAVICRVSCERFSLFEKKVGLRQLHGCGLLAIRRRGDGATKQAVCCATQSGGRAWRAQGSSGRSQRTGSAGYSRLVSARKNSRGE